MDIRKQKKIVIITKAKDNIVYEFNNRPAAVVYSELTGAPLEEMRKNMLTFLTKNPLGIADIEGNYWLNCPYAVVEDTALAFFEPPPDDAAMAIMESTKKEILKSVKESIHLATYGLKDISTLIVFSCAAHLLYLEKDIVEEYKLIRKLTGKQPFIGFSTYAEHATIPTGSVLKHGYTFACLGITNRLISD